MNFQEDLSDAVRKELVYKLPVLNPESQENYLLVKQWSKKYEKFDLSGILQLEDRLKQKIIGQEEAVKATVDAILCYAAGINDPEKPIGTFFYVGPTGVGKTELARQLCRELFESESNMLVLNMAEFALEHTIDRLIGVPPGYKESEKGGQLTNFLSKYPYSIILFDEIEKAHPDILKLLLQTFDEGKISNAYGKVIHCSNTIFIMTSNLYALEIAYLFDNGMGYKDVVNVLKPNMMAALSPEFYNRIEPVFFRPLGQESIREIALKFLSLLKSRIKEKKDIDVIFDETIIDYLVLEGYDPVLGARPMRHLIEKGLTTLVATAILDGSCLPGDRLTFSYSDEQIVVTVSR